jgi:hypothetical protein
MTQGSFAGLLGNDHENRERKKKKKKSLGNGMS